jgi:hypothetical protein
MTSETVHSSSDSGGAIALTGATPGLVANNLPYPPAGLMFDAFGSPRVRYVRVVRDGGTCVMTPLEADDYKQTAEHYEDGGYEYVDVYLSEQEFDNLPEFGGW